MTSGEPPVGPSAAKLGGYALIGAGALAAVLGASTMMFGSSDNAAQPTEPAPVPSSESPQQPVPPPPPPAASTPPAQKPGDAGQPSPEPSPAPNPLPPYDAGQQSPPPQGGNQGENDPVQAKVIVRVYNNSTIKGLAQRAADDFRRAGYDVPEVGNYAAGRIYTTTVYFRPGTEEEGQARDVAAHFGARLEPRFEGIEHSRPGVIAIITNDYKGPAASK
jgi:hypothetical protein